MLLAGNQLGKTKCAAEEGNYHATGDYPHWWRGKRFPGPTRGWVANTNWANVVEAPQRLLMGDPDQWGTGTIPRSAIAKAPKMSRAFPDLVHQAFIKHRSGGVSTIGFKAYEQGYEKFQGGTLDWGWWDEEPDKIMVYTEFLARITATGGCLFGTMTPLLGPSEVVRLFWPEPSTDQRHLTQMNIDEAKHFDEEERAIIVAAYPDHQRDARARGMPMLGEGAIFKLPRETIECQVFEIPRHWHVLGGVDFGYGDHPFAAVKVAWDKDADVLYLTREFKEKRIEPAMHADCVSSWGGEQGLRWAWPHDGHRQWGDSGPIKDVYADKGMRMLHEHSTFPSRDGTSGGYSTEAAVQLLLSRMQSGRFKAFCNLDAFWLELSTYHRKKGLIVKEHDDLLSALYKCLMMLRFARPPDDGARQYAARVDDRWDEFGSGWDDE